MTSGPAEIGEIARMLETFDRATDRLDASYRRIEVLQVELAEKDRQLARKTRFEALGRMASGLAHEIRNPLGGIRLYAGLLRREVASDVEKVATLDKILSAVSDLNRLVEDMLLYGRDVAPRKEPVPIGPLVDDVLALVPPHPGIEIRRGGELEGGIFADGPMLRRALLNVILNAVEAMEPGGLIDVTVTRPDERVRIAVADTGPGFPPSVLGMPFAPFHTLKAKGTGLGLPLAQKIAEAHGGRLEARNRPEGGAEVALVI
jgi:signal transduction histidine kinase